MSIAAEARAKRNVACPSCGAAVRFRGATSLVSVCPYCKSTLVREGVDVENIGKQAELIEDHSPIRIGTEGTHRGDGFTVVGRIQFRYDAGTWNEWYVLFRRSRGAWLSDASREYAITFLQEPEPLPALGALQPGSVVVLKGGKSYAGSYTVTNIDHGEVVAGEGELPFRFKAGWRADVVDLRGDGAHFATIDYSEDPPHLYAGEKLPFDAFRFSGLRDPEQAGGFTRGTALAFKCGGCGAPIEKHLATTEAIACGACGTVSDVTGTAAQVVQRNERNMRKVRKLLPLGAVGAWKGVRYEIVGFMRRGVTFEGETWEWSEWLLHNVERGYAWITEYNGHFNFVHAAAEVPRPGKGSQLTLKYLGHTFRHFSRSEAKVTHLDGEFYWRVKLGEAATCDDYVAPPLVLSSEKTGKEITWSLGEYVEGPELWKAISLPGKPPKPVGVASNQPSPHKGRVQRFWLAFLLFLTAGLAAQASFWALQPSSRWTTPFEIPVGAPSSRLVSGPFELGGVGATPATIRIDSNADSDWLVVGLKLTNADTGQAFSLDRQLGQQRVGTVVEGSREDVAEIPAVPPGRYTLAVEARSPRPVTGTVSVYRAQVGWSNFWLFTAFAGLWPLIATLRAWAFETKRWSESDYAADSSDDEDE